MTTALVVETSVTVNYNSPIQDYVHSDDQTQPTFIIEIVKLTKDEGTEEHHCFSRALEKTNVFNYLSSLHLL